MENSSENDDTEPKSNKCEEQDVKKVQTEEIIFGEKLGTCNSVNESSIVESGQPDLQFKMPALVDSKVKIKKPKTVSDVVTSDLNGTPITISSSSQQNKQSNKILAPVPYQEPEWGSNPPNVYSLEVLKNGQIVSQINLNEKSYFVFGRMESCQIVMEHPSVSRFHAVLQYRGDGEDNQKGFYVYDLESTHGTFLNKKQLRPRSYYKMHVGHMLKLGGSSRVYILQGPDEDQEPEDELTVTELKAKRIAMEVAALTKAADKPEEQEESSAGEGIDWGFGEDATEDPITENPFAVSTPNEDLYLEDPKKTLRGWFEREGYELEYNVEEKGFGHFLCRIELPIDSTNGEAVYAEASVKGKKKEAVVAAALEACRVLDSHGVLRQSQHDSRKRKEKDWESQDFYDSDEDTYLDRTGTIEKKRQFRKKMMKKDDLDNVETYDSLVAKLKDIEKEITEVQKKLEEANQTARSAVEVNSEQDSLEAFMANLQNFPGVDKKAKSQLSLQLSALQQEKMHLEKLVKIAQPTVLPPLQTTPKKCPAEIQKSLMKKIMPMTGAIKGRTLGRGIKTNSKAVETAKYPKTDKKECTENEGVVEEEEEEDEEEKEDGIKEKEVEAMSDETGKEEVSKKPISVNITQNQATSEGSTKTRSIDDTKMEPSTHENMVECNNGKDKVTSPAISPEEKQGTEKKKRQRRANHRKANLESLNPDYSMWLPPDNQTGDGKTYLNDKFGY